MRLVTLGVGAQNSPRYHPAGLLVARGRVRVMIDGGPGSEPTGRLDAWLVTDERGELMPAIRRLARARGLVPAVRDFEEGGLRAEAKPVVHTNHPSFGYLIRGDRRTVVWAPEFLRFPLWAAGADLMFAEASGWNRPIRFVGGVGGHLDTLAVAEAARRNKVMRLVFAHIGRPSIRAIDAGERPPFGEFGEDGRVYVIRRRP